MHAVYIAAAQRQEERAGESECSDHRDQFKRQAKVHVLRTQRSWVQLGSWVQLV